MNRSKFTTIYIVASLLFCFLICTDALAKDVDVLGILNFELSDNVIIQDRTLHNNEVYSIFMKDDNMLFTASLDVKGYTQEQILQCNVEYFKEALSKQKSFRSFVSFDKTYLKGMPIDIIIYNSCNPKGVNFRSKLYILKYQKYIFFFTAFAPTLAPSCDFFENNSKIMDKIISTIKFK